MFGIRSRAEFMSSIVHSRAVEPARFFRAKRSSNDLSTRHLVSSPSVRGEGRMKLNLGNKVPIMNKTIMAILATGILTAALFVHDEWLVTAT